CFVTGVTRDFFHVLVIKSVGHRKTIHSNSEPLLEQRFAADNFLLEPLFILGTGQSLSCFFCAWFRDRDRMIFAQILMRGGMRFDVDSVIAHIAELVPSDRVASGQSAVGYTLRV